MQLINSERAYAACNNKNLLSAYYVDEYLFEPVSTPQWPTAAIEGLAKTINGLALAAQHERAKAAFLKGRVAAEKKLPGAEHQLKQAFHLNPENADIYNAYHAFLCSNGQDEAARETQIHFAAITGKPET